jgi:peptidoglycan/LPS O-acetylase OafA/YrhL
MLYAKSIPQMVQFPEVKLLAATPATGTTRNCAIDHIRIVLTALVVFHHVAIVYGGAGGWYWREQPNASNPVLVMFNAVNQAFFMGFFFLLAGYYTHSSYQRKGAGRFLAGRLLRLGVPLLFYFFVLAPFTVALANTSKGLAFWPGWWTMTRSGAFGPGPLWFAEALLLFSGLYVVWRQLRPTTGAAAGLPGVGVLAFTALVLGCVSFLVRLEMPTGREFAWLQLGYFPCYIYLFVAGCVAGRTHLLEQVTLRQAQPWMIVSLLAILTLPLVVFLHVWRGTFNGGWNFNALYYALWDPLVAWGVILGMLWAVRIYWSHATPFTDWLAHNAYGVYIVHPPIVVGASLMAAAWTLNPLAKFAIVGTAACVGSLLAAALLRSIPGARQIL